MSKMRVCVDARLVGEPGGIRQVVIGLAYGLSQLADEGEEYCFLAYPGSDSWLLPYLGGQCRLLHTRVAPQKSSIRAFGRSIPFLRRIWSHTRTSGFHLPVSDGTIEREVIDLMHFTGQGAFVTGIPSIYHPHDLQHLHLPELFTPRDVAAREFTYRRFCEQASMVAVVTSLVRDDLIEHYGLPGEKVRVVPLAPSISTTHEPTAGELDESRNRMRLPDAFLFYPAQTWAHKNHIGLLRALAVLRDRYHMTLHFVSSGTLNQYFYSHIRKTIDALELSSQVHFLGFVSPSDLQALYRLARCVVIPTLFEAASFPVWDAFLAGTPVACSNVTSLPRQAGDAALVFDPRDVDGMAEAIADLWTNEPLRLELAARGRKNVAQFSWERTARIFRAHYRRLGGRPLTADDEGLLNSPSSL